MPRSKLPHDHARDGARSASATACSIANVFHAGDGNLHPLICYDDRKPEELERAKEANEELLHACIALGRQRHRRARRRRRQGQEAAAAVRRRRPQLHVPPARRVRSRRHLMNPGKLLALAPGLRRGLPPAAPVAARRRVDLRRLSVTGRAVARRARWRPIVGAEHVTDDAGRDSRPPRVDGVTPRWVVRGPRTLSTVARCSRSRTRRRWRSSRAASGCALELGAPPARVDVVLDLAGLDAIVEYNPDDLTVTRAGGRHGRRARRLTWPRTARRCRSTRRAGARARSAASPPRRPAARCACATAPCAICCSACGSCRPTACVTWGGAKVVKSVTGYDVPKLMVGSLGTLGVLGELTLRLHPLPEVEATWLVDLCAPWTQRRSSSRALLDSTLAAEPPRDARRRRAGGLRAAARRGRARGLLRAAWSRPCRAAGERGLAEVAGARARCASRHDRGRAFWRAYDRVMARRRRGPPRRRPCPTRLAATVA